MNFIFLIHKIRILDLWEPKSPISPGRSKMLSENNQGYAADA